MHAGRRSIRVVGVELVHVVLLGVEVVEHEPEDDTDQERSAGQTDEHPQDGGVEGGGGQGLGQGGTEGVGEQIHGLHERLHRGRSLGVGVLQTGHGSENLRDTDEHVGRSLDGNVDPVALGGAVDFRGITERLIVTRTGRVDKVLHNSGVHHGKRGDDETQRDTSDGTEADMQTAQQRVDQGLQDGDEDNDRDGIKVLHQIVGNTVALHLCGLGDEVAGELAIDNPVDGEEAEDTASDQSTLELINEVVVPGKIGPVATIGSLPGGLGSIHVAVGDHNSDSLKGVGNDRALRGPNNVVLASNNEHQSTTGEHAQTEQVAGPEANVPLHVRSSQQRQRAKVDAAVEDHVDTLDGQSRINDDPLTLLGSRDSHLLALVLIGNQGRNVTLDTTCSQTDDQNGDNETTKTSTVLESGRDRCADQDQETDQVHATEEHNGLVFSEVLISNDGTKNRSN